MGDPIVEPEGSADKLGRKTPRPTKTGTPQSLLEVRQTESPRVLKTGLVTGFEKAQKEISVQEGAARYDAEAAKRAAEVTMAQIRGLKETALSLENDLEETLIEMRPEVRQLIEDWKNALPITESRVEPGGSSSIGEGDKRYLQTGVSDEVRSGILVGPDGKTVQASVVVSENIYKLVKPGQNKHQWQIMEDGPESRSVSQEELRIQDPDDPTRVVILRDSYAGVGLTESPEDGAFVSISTPEQGKIWASDSRVHIDREEVTGVTDEQNSATDPLDSARRVLTFVKGAELQPVKAPTTPAVPPPATPVA